MNLPTVDDLVNVFFENNWLGKRVDGASVENIREGKCCAIPALVKIMYPQQFNTCLDMEDNDNATQYMYDIISNNLGKEFLNNLYCAFDNGWDCNDDASKLGLGLRAKLEELNMMINDD